MLDITQYPSHNFNDRPKNTKIDYIILHYTDTLTMQDALDILCDPKAEVSSHYAIAEDGMLYQLVDDSKRAWHAGLSKWKGVENLNNNSIGIEIQNKGHHFGYAVTGTWPEFPKIQIDNLKQLLKHLMQKYTIAPQHILGHEDIAPGRKIDPGPAFPWHELLELGINRQEILKE